MLDLIKVSSIIMAWFAVFSLIWQFTIFEWFGVQEEVETLKGSSFIFPAIVLSPLVLVIGFRLLGIYLIFPVNIISDSLDQIKSGIVPGLIVFLASGMASSIVQNTKQAVNDWAVKPFCIMGQAYGFSKKNILRKVVCSSSFLDSLQRCLPWIFGELFIVECIFNAPGLSYEAWKSAKSEDLESLTFCISIIACLYLLTWISQSLYSLHIKRRLTNYV